jgi:hypothetical protein
VARRSACPQSERHHRSASFQPATAGRLVRPSSERTPAEPFALGIIFDENAQEFAKAKNIPALKEQLGLLWQHAPYYGDPAGLARLAGLKVPPSFQEATNAQGKVERVSKRKQQRNEFVTSSQGLSFDPSFVWSVWGFPFCLLIGVGASIGALSQSWTWAVGATAALALLSYLLGYRRALRLIDISIILLISAALVFAATWFLSTFQYDQPQVSDLWFNAVRTLTLRHQILFGAFLGGVGTLVDIYLTLIWGDDFADYSVALAGMGIFVIVGALAVRFIVAILGSVFDWGFGFGYGWSFTLLAGFPATFIGGTSLIASIYICAKALTNSPEKIHSQEEKQKADAAAKKAG